MGVDEGAPASAAKSMAMSLGVTAGLTGLAAGERLFAAAVGGLAERGLPGHERLYRPLGHLAALSALGGGLYGLMRRVDRRIEQSAEQIETAYEVPPTSRWSPAAPAAPWPGTRSAARAAATWPPCSPASLDERPAEKRPRVVLFGESLGAWTSQDAFTQRGTQGLADAGVDRAIWIGTPYMSKWKEEVL